MGRIMGIDFGTKRTGIAVTDPLRIIATALETVETKNLFDFLEAYFQREQVDEIVVGLPKTLRNEDSGNAPSVRVFAQQFKQKFPNKPLNFIDERFTSSIAKQTMIAGGMKKKDRQVKGNVDKISATLILQSYLSGM
jgi:putative holliday junction resolvase